MALPEDFLEQAVDGEEFLVSLPGDRRVSGTVTMIRRDEKGVLFVQGFLRAPDKGRFFFQRQTLEGVAGSLAGNILFDDREEAWKVEPSGTGGAPRLIRTHRDGVVCANYRIPPPEQAPIENAPEDHPIDIPIPDYQTIIPLQSLPGAVGVIYLDFDGEAGPFPGWGDFDAVAPGVTNVQVHEVWKMVCEDFQGFNLNVTTDRRVFDNAIPGRRQHVVISPTTAASPGSGGVAYVGSYNWSTSTVCWAFYSVGKFCAEVISHEVGHSLGLSHDGRVAPPEDYYYGHGSGETGWAPIMGAGYYENLTQWSKGEYQGANRTQDDLSLITSNNSVGYRTDDIGDDLATARYLEISADGTVSNEGIIERSSDVDSFRFVTTGGPVEIRIDPVSANPNLDVLAELVDVSTGNYLLSVNPELEIGSTISTTLPAGEYLVEVSGAGKGEPLLDGYSDYGSLGSYFVSGTVPDGVKPDRFTVTENTSTGSMVGSIAARLDHGASVLSWSIESGNAGGGFAIDEETGEITVVDSSALNFEALSTRWDDPATVELHVLISDPADPNLDERVRVVITVSNLNEAPVMSGGEVTLLERTRPGTALFTMTSSDADRFDIPTYAILSGNEDGQFIIDQGSGVVSVSEAGIGEVNGSQAFSLVVQVSDPGGAAAVATLDLSVIDIPAGYVPGGITRTYYEGITGSSVASLTNATSRWPDHPDSEESLPAFDGLPHGDNFGSTLRGYFIPPVSGSYRFWISSDGSSQLWLDSTADQTGASQIASVSGGTEHYSWPDSSPYRSSPVSLVAGKPYYIEALHKESTGADHVAVAFSGPGIGKQLLGGRYLVPFVTNYAPETEGAILTIGENAFAGQLVGLVPVSDVNTGDLHGGFAITGGNTGGAFEIDPATGMIRVATGGVMDSDTTPSYVLTVSVSDNGSPALSGSGQVTINVLPEGYFADNGIVQQIWTGVPGTDLESIEGDVRYPYEPSTVRFLSSYDSGESQEDDYASRIRALVTPPVSGYYTFYLSSNDKASLLLGSSASPAGAQEIASVDGWCFPGEWVKYPSQEAAPVYLTAGTDYYIETLHKDGSSSDHVQVAWTGPDIPAVTVIPGDSLKPYDINEAPVFSASSMAFTIVEGAVSGTAIGEASAQDPEQESVIHAIISGNESGVFVIDAATGVVSIAEGAVLAVGEYVIGIGAQDRGLEGNYPLKTSSVTVTVTVQSNNQAPSFAGPSQSIGATEDEAVEEQFAASDPDEEDVLVFSKVSGPDWLSVDADGAFGGRPANADVGLNLFVVRVTDPEGLFDEMELSVMVANVNDPPVFTGLPIELPLATQGAVYEGSLEGAATDIDADDSVSYAKVSGPPWLSIAADGTFAGLPANADVGINEFSLRATDQSGAFSETTFSIVVENVNDPPVFLTPLLAASGATEDEPYSASISGEASDPDTGDELTFALLSGPSWLSIGTDGSLAGVPENSDVGSNVFVVRVTDVAGTFAEASLVVEVTNTNDAPFFHGDPVIGNTGTETEAYDGFSLATKAEDADAGETITFSKIEGPEWLVVGEDGSLAGTPPSGSGGLNTFTVRVTDMEGSFAETTLLVDVTINGLPLPWNSGEVGDPVAEGSIDHTNGEFVVSGAGELAGRNDSFQFVWQPLSEDGTITARVKSTQETGSSSRAGVMIRDSLAANSRHVFMGVTEGGGFRWVRRTGYNGNTSTSNSGSATFPDAWVRLVRSGSVITAYKSSDGESWVKIGSLTAEFPTTCYFGLAVASGDPGLLNEARFSNVSITP